MGSLVPFETVRDLLNEEASLFERFFTRGVRGLKPLSGLLAKRLKFPAIEIKDGKEDIVVKTELPGVERKDLKVNIEGNLLTIQGESHRQDEVKKDDYHYTERTYGSFYRSIPLSTSVLKERAKASYKDGILKIELKKEKKVESKDAEIAIE